MTEAINWDMDGTLLEVLPPETEGSPQYRELVAGSLRRCFDYLAMMSVEGRRRTHIETADGGRIGPEEIAAHFSDAPADPIHLRPTDLV